MQSLTSLIARAKCQDLTEDTSGSRQILNRIDV